MSQLDLAKGGPQALSPATDPSVAAPRVDPPHVFGSASAELTQHEIDKLKLQARQIAGLLRRRKEDLDRREAQLHQHLALHDKELRTARLWFESQREQLSERERQLEQRESTLNQRLERLTHIEGELSPGRPKSAEESHPAAGSSRLADRVDETVTRLVDQTRALTTARASLLEQREAFEREHRYREQRLIAEREAQWGIVRQAHRQLDEHRQALERREQDLHIQMRALTRRQSEASPQELERLELIARREQELVERAVRLEQAEQTLEQERHAVARQRDELREADELRIAQAQADRRRLVEIESRQRAAWDQRREQLEQFAETIDVRRAALEQELEDLTNRHRETLELRLAAEELWADVTRGADPVLVARSLSATRQRIAELFKFEQALLERQQRELEQLREQLSGEQERLGSRQAELQSWLEARRLEVEQHAAQLVARECELETEGQAWQTERDAWQQEREQFELERRRLHAELRRAEQRVWTPSAQRV